MLKIVPQNFSQGSDPPTPFWTMSKVNQKKSFPNTPITFNHIALDQTASYKGVLLVLLN